LILVNWRFAVARLVGENTNKGGKKICGDLATGLHNLKEIFALVGVISNEERVSNKQNE